MSQNNLPPPPIENQHKQDNIGYNLINEKIKHINFNPIIFDDAKIEIDEDLVKLWLNNKKFNAELLFTKTRDDSNPNDSHNKCDNKGITITFIETTKGYKFGGYTELQWDKSTFIFFFDRKEKCLALSNKSSISCTKVMGYILVNLTQIYIFIIL